MSFKYINPGFNVGDFTQAGAGRAKAVSDYTSSGKSLYAKATYTVPEPSKTMYASFSMTISGSVYATDGFSCFMYDINKGNKTGAFFAGTIDAYTNGSKVESKPITSSLKRFYHMEIKSGETDGEIRIFEDGVLKYEATGINVMNGENIGFIEMYSRNIDVCYSDLIFSNEYFPVSERVIALPIAETTSTMTDNGDGSYTATEADQTILQTVDVEKLKESIGEGNTITGFAIVGNPAYYSGDEITTIAGIRNGIVKASAPLGTTDTSIAMMSWGEKITQENLGAAPIGIKAQA